MGVLTWKQVDEVTPRVMRRHTLQVTMAPTSGSSCVSVSLTTEITGNCQETGDTKIPATYKINYHIIEYIHVENHCEGKSRHIRPQCC